MNKLCIYIPSIAKMFLHFGQERNRRVEEIFIHDECRAMIDFLQYSFIDEFILGTGDFIEQDPLQRLEAIRPVEASIVILSAIG